MSSTEFVFVDMLLDSLLCIRISSKSKNAQLTAYTRGLVGENISKKGYMHANQM